MCPWLEKRQLILKRLRHIVDELLHISLSECNMTSYIVILYINSEVPHSCSDAKMYT
jgi:hypothetical protein